jgi:hypothetical protein
LCRTCPDRDSSRPRKRLLRALPDECFRRLAVDLQTVPIKLKHVFYKPEQPLPHVYFPNGGVVSITTLLANGSMVEAATIGDEGMVGIEAFLGEPALSPGETMMQVPDTNVEMLDISAFRRELALCGPLSELLGRYTQAMIMLGVRRQTVAIVAGVLQEAG